MRLKARLTCSAVLAVALLPAGAGLVFAQAVNGSIVGNVADGTGAALPGATLSVTETRTGVTRSATSNASGHYVALNLQDGVYRVEAALAGFKTAARGGVVVRVNTTVRVDFTLQLGEVSETIDVVGGAPALQTDRADTGRLIEGRQVAELPLGFGRNFQGLLVTVPGATRPFRPHSEFFNPQDSLSSQVNGQSRLSNNVQIEGIDNNYRIGVLNMLIPSADAIEGVSVSTSNFNAELGRAAGAVTSVTLKSGTNDVRGSLFFFGNDERLMARDYFTGNRAETDYRQYGLTLGGPLRRNKLFFFVDYQRTRDDLGRVNRHNIPPMEWRTGDLSGAPTRIYDPATGNADGTGRQVFPGNRIPADRISPIARNLLALLPEPNVPGAALGQTNYIVNTTRRRDTHGVNVKLNLQASERDALALRLSFQRPELEDPGSFGVYGGPANGGFAGSGHQNTYGTALNYTRTMNASLLFEARAGFSYYRNEALTQGHGLRTSEEVGIRGANLDDFTSALTTLTIGGFSNPLLGFSSSIPWEIGRAHV